MTAGPSLTVVAPTPFYTDGGCSYRVLGETRAFIRAGVKTRLLTYPSGQDVEGIPITRPYRSHREVGLGLRPLRPVYDVELLRLLLRSPPEAGFLQMHLHEGALMGLWERALRRRHYLLDLQGSLVDEVSRTFPWVAGGVVGRLSRWFERVLERSASHLVVSSVGLLDALRSRGHLPAEQVHLVPDGVDVTLFAPRESTAQSQRLAWRKARGLSERDVVAIYVGSISPEQGIDELLNRASAMLEQAPQLRFLIFGATSQLNAMDTYVEKVKRLGLQGRVLLPGPLRFEDVPAALAASDLGIAWKQSPLEGSGKIPIYMAAGLPTVAVETPAHAYYLGADGSRGGILCRDRKQAAQGIVSLALDASRREVLGLRAREVAERELSWDHAAQQLLKIHEQVLAER